MHAAPPVRIDLAPDRMAGHAVLVLSAMAAANGALWLGALFEWKGVALGMFGLLAAIAAAAWLHGKQLGCTGLLTWDGNAWLWLPAAQRSAVESPVRPRMMLDLGGWMLLRLEPLDRSRSALWGVATRQGASSAWSAWRAALLARASAEQPLPRTPA